jgi:antitoxin component of MazEF toxin-antitoxin module
MSEFRKIQQQGKSLAISLPHEWSKEQNLMKGSYISMSKSKGKGDKLIVRKLRQEQEQEEDHIDT